MCEGCIPITVHLLLCIILPCAVSAEEYYVMPANSSQLCPPSGQPCRTISEYADEADDFPSNTTMIFLEGEHTLSRNFSVRDVEELSLTVAPGGVEAFVKCLHDGDYSFVVRNAQTISITGLVFIGCYGNEFNNASNFEVQDSLFKGLATGGQAALRLFNIKSGNIFNCSFVSYEVKGYNGIIGCALLYLDGRSNISILKSEFLANSAELTINPYLSSMACIFRSELTIEDSSFADNRARTGGVFYVETSATLTVRGSTFTNNSAVFGEDGEDPFGGVGYISRGSNVTMDTCCFSENHSELEGGVFYMERESIIKVNHCLFQHNRALPNPEQGSGGGAIVVKENSEAYFYNTSFIGNLANKGGSITTFGSSALYLTNSTFDSNEARSLKRIGDSYGGVLNSEDSTIFISECDFRNNFAHTSGGCIYIRTSSLHVNGSNMFYNNSAVFYGGAFTVFNSVVNINKDSTHCCTCEEANYQVEFLYNSAEHGGAMNVISNSVAYIQCSSFQNNSAQRNTSTGSRGGAILARTNTTIYLTDTHFYDNKANGKGGILFAQFADVSFAGHLIVDSNRADSGVVYLSSCNATLEGNTTFFNNEKSFLAHYSDVVFKGNTEFSGGMVSSQDREEGGALTALRSSVTIWGSMVMENNHGEKGGGIYSRDSIINSYGQCAFRNNSAVNGGGLYAYNSEVHFRGDTIHEANRATGGNGGAILALSSIIEYSTCNSSLHGNSAENGGAIYLGHTSSLYIVKQNMECENMDDKGELVWYCVGPDKWLYVSFSDNSASEKGGALYVDDNDASSCNRECFIQSIAVYESANDWNTTEVNFKNLVFTNNSASEDGDLLYGGLLDRCAINKFAEQRQILKDSFIPDPLAYLSNMSVSDFPNSEISSGPMRICFCEDDSDVFNCSLPSPEIEVLSGKMFKTLSVAIVNEVNKSITGEVEAYLSSSSSKLGKDQSIQLVNHSCSVLEYTVFSTDTVTLYLYAKGGPCLYHGISRAEISIHINESCPAGFAMSDSSLECECDPSIRQFVSTCSIDSESVVRQGSFWISGEFDKNSSRSVGVVVHDNCPYDYCRPATEEIEVNLNSESGSDAQCAFNRSGRLCGSCKKNYSLTLGSSKCDECANYGLLLILPFVLVGVGLVVLMMACNLTLAAGTLNGPLLYANILIANRAVFFPFQKEDVLTIFVSWLGLNLGISTCFYSSMDAFAKMWMQVAFEVYLILLVLLIVVLGRSVKVATFFHKYNLTPVNTLATLLMLSYEKLSRKIFSLLAFTHLKYANETERVWLFDPNVSYLKNEHIPLFVVALFILVTGIFFNLSLLFSKLIIAKSKSVYINKFLEAFHAPFKSNHKYWVGLLLLIRNISYFTSEFLSAGKNPTYSLSFVFALVVGLLGLKLVYIWVATLRFPFAKLKKQGYETVHPPLRDEEDDKPQTDDDKNQPDDKGEHNDAKENGIVYKSCVIDLLETSFILNIALLTYFTLYIGGEEGKQSILFYVSSSIVLVTFVGILIYHSFTYTCVSIFLKNRKKRIAQKMQGFDLTTESYGSIARLPANPTRSEIATV